MSKEATLGQLIEMCNTVGWIKGVKELEAVTLRWEEIQADLFGSGESGKIKRAQQLAPTIIAQNITIGKLKAMPEYLAEFENQQQHGANNTEPE